MHAWTLHPSLRLRRAQYLLSRIGTWRHTRRLLRRLTAHRIVVLQYPVGWPFQIVELARTGRPPEQCAPTNGHQHGEGNQKIKAFHGAIVRQFVVVR